jgi:hypothetical protein
MAGLCLLHDPPLEIADSRDGRWMFRHLELDHPEVYGRGPDRWPDGALVVYDQTIQPQNLQELDR